MNTAKLRQTVYQEIDHLSEQQLIQVLEFIQQVGHGKQVQSSNGDQNPDPCDLSSASVTDDWSDFIGSIDAESDLSSNYKNYLNQELGEKYDYH